MYHGPQNVASESFQELAWDSIGTVYVSAAEGGPGSVAQLLHFGIIPIVTRASNVRAEHLGYVIDHTSDNAIIDGIVSTVHHIDGLSGEELMRRCAMVREHALSCHTREAYSRSFDELIEEIERERKETRRYASG
jgi:hypothetical protein